MATEEQLAYTRQETAKHRARVKHYMSKLITELALRSTDHDRSKDRSPEVEVFAEVTPKLRGLTYGSPEYKESLKEMGVALDHHYEENRHHPEHFSHGLTGMNLADVVEMLCDWMAATERHADGDIYKSLEYNRGRFDIGEDLYLILKNTVTDILDERLSSGRIRAVR